MKVVEYQIRSIDDSGDVIDITDYFEGRGSFQKAMKKFSQTVIEGAAIVLEKAVYHGSQLTGIMDVDYVTVAARGDVKALCEGDWLPVKR